MPASLFVSRQQTQLSHSQYFTSDLPAGAVLTSLLAQQGTIRLEGALVIEWFGGQECVCLHIIIILLHRKMKCILS